MSFQPAPAAAASSSASDRSHLVRSTSGDSTVRQAAVAALANDTQRPTVEVASAPASSAAEEEERKLFMPLCCVNLFYHQFQNPLYLQKVIICHHLMAHTVPFKSLKHICVSSVMYSGILKQF